MNGGTPICKNCDLPMGKAGFAISGKSRVQRYRCSQCLTTTTVLSIDGISNNNHHNRHYLDFNDLEEAQINLRAIKSEMGIEQYLKSLIFRER